MVVHVGLFYIEGFSRFPYNNNKAIGFGLDFYLRPDISINYEGDGGIREKEGYRLLKIIMGEMKIKINKDLKEMNLKVKQNVFDSLIDLYYTGETLIKGGSKMSVGSGAVATGKVVEVHRNLNF